MKVAKRLAAVCMILVFALSFTACNTNAKSVGTVNGESIPVNEFKYVFDSICQQMLQEASAQEANVENFWETETEGKKAIDIARDNTFDQLAQGIIAAQIAKEQGIEISDTDKQTIAKTKSQQINQMGGDSAYNSFLEQMGLDDTYLDKILEQNFYAQKLFEKLSAEDASFAVDEAAIEQDIMENQVMAKHILIKTVDDNNQDLSADQIAAAKQKAEDILQQIRNGADFDTLMKENSQDPGMETAPNGYIFGKGVMMQEFEDAAFALQENEVSDLVQTSYGYHIIKRVPIDKNDSEYENAKETAKQNLQSDIFMQYIEDAVKNADIVKNTEVLNTIEPPEATPTASAGAIGTTGQ